MTSYEDESKLKPKAEANPFRLRFLGAAGTVTGSKYLLTNDKINILVDCGLFQGLKELRLKNWDRFPIDPKTINAIILTHAHLDHSGYIPRLIKERVAPILKFKHNGIEVKIHGIRQDVPPKIEFINYEIIVDTNEEDSRLDLLHKNIKKYGTVFNTVASGTTISGKLSRKNHDQTLFT